MGRDCVVIEAVQRVIREEAGGLVVAAIASVIRVRTGAYTANVSEL